MLDEHKLFELVGLFKKKVTLLNLFNYFEYLGLQYSVQVKCDKYAENKKPGRGHFFLQHSNDRVKNNMNAVKLNYAIFFIFLKEKKTMNKIYQVQKIKTNKQQLRLVQIFHVMIYAFMPLVFSRTKYISTSLPL